MIKKVGSKLCLAILLLALASPCWAQSFRFQASGDLLYGDYDNDIDPIYIWENDGYRIYSTLSNLSSSSDKFISNANNGVYLFATSGNFGLPDVNGWQSRTMFLVRLSDSRSDNNSGLDTDYDGLIDQAGEGYMSGDRVLFFDVNSDNIYDSRVNMTSTADNYDLLKMRDWKIIHSYKFLNSKIGISFSHLGYGNNFSESNVHSGLFSFASPSHNFSYSNSLMQTDLSTFDVLETRNESGDFRTTCQTPANIFDLAYETGFGLIPNSKIRFDVSLELLKDKYQVDDKYDYFRDVSAGGIVDMNRLSDEVKVDSSLGGYTFTPSVRLTKNWTPEVYSWFDFAFGFGKFDADKAFSENYDSEIQLTDMGGNLSITTRDYDDVVDQTGDTKRKNIGLFHKTVVDFTEKFTFSAGIDFFFRCDKTDWNADYLTTYNGAFDNGDGVSDANDSSFTQVSSMSANLIAENKTTIINLPVAMEYALGRWTFRLGAVHQIHKQVEDEDFLIKESDPVVTTINYGDGDSSITVSDNDYLSIGSSRESKSSSTNFVYGLELKANDNLKIELIQFMETANVDVLNTNFYRQLRLSLTVIF